MKIEKRDSGQGDEEALRDYMKLGIGPFVVLGSGTGVADVEATAPMIRGRLCEREGGRRD